MKMKEVSISASAVMALLTVENFSDLHVFAAAFYVNTWYIILTKEEQKKRDINTKWNSQSVGVSP